MDILRKFPIGMKLDLLISFSLLEVTETWTVTQCYKSHERTKDFINTFLKADENINIIEDIKFNLNTVD